MGAFAFDVSSADFNQIVIEGSKKAPVIVDFWAEWCGPCRALKPILEKLADEYQGKFILAKVNSDENQELANRYGVRGIPNVKAFVNGELVDEFSGALPEGAVREFIDRLIPSPSDELRVAAMQVYREENDTAKALQMLAEASKMDPKNERVRIDAAEIMLDNGEVDEAKRLLTSLHPATVGETRVQNLLARLEFAANAGSSDTAELEARIAKDENDLAARLDLAKVLVNQQQYAPAMDQLLEIIRRDRSYEDDAARKTILSIFNLLGGAGPLVSEYRKKLASALN